MHAIVIGGGPAGLSVSLGLAKEGFTIDILEKHTSYAVKGSTLGLQPNGIKALKEICENDDLVEKLVQTGVVLPTGGSVGGTMVPWWTIHDFLQERVKEQPNKIKLHMGVTLRSFDDTTDASCVKVHCEQGDFQGDLLIGADGVHSQMRSLLNLSPEKSTGFFVWRGSCIADEPPLTDLLNQSFRPLPMNVYGSTTFTVFNHHPKLPRRLNWAVSSSDPSIVQGTTTPWDLMEPYTRGNQYRAVMQAILQKSEPHELVSSMPKSTIDLPEDDGNGWGGAGRVTLIGDAAHAMRPAAGQGISLAFEDAVVLCHKMEGKKLVSREEWEELISEFENERLPRVKRIQAEQETIMKELYGGNKDYCSPIEYTEWVFGGV